MDNTKNDLVEKLKAANNILVTVSRNPSVDQLSALLGLTLLLNKLGKHGAAVFSGEVPSTIEFLQPEETIEKNTDSLRDFIIALDKSKADKLRYKVENNVVRIFITPYKTSITEGDLEFSQGDFNVDAVVAIGVANQEDLDEAILAHGRILHDAVVTSILLTPGEGGLGTINWRDPQASSLSELVAELAQAMGEGTLDAQIATALLTGIVAETERFSNSKTSALTMSVSATLMAAGANQQLVASKLDEPALSQQQSSDDAEDEPHDEDDGDDTPPTEPEEPPKPNDGTLEIEHDGSDGPDSEPEITEQQLSEDQPQPTDLASDSGADLSADDQVLNFSQTDNAPAEPGAQPGGLSETAPTSDLTSGSKLITEAPSLGGTLTANSQPEALDPSSDPLSVDTAPAPLLSHDEPVGPAPAEPVLLPPPVAPAPQPTSDFIPGMTPPPPAWVPPNEDPLNLNTTPAEPVQTLSQLEDAVDTPTPADIATAEANARDEVMKALQQLPGTPEPVQSLNAVSLGEITHDSPSEQPGPGTPPPAPEMPAPAPELTSTPPPPAQSQPMVTDPNAPPPVPPPIPFQFGSGQSS